MLDFAQILIIFFFRHFKELIYSLRIPKYQKILAMIFGLYLPLLYLETTRIFQTINAHPNYFKLLKTSRFESGEQAQISFRNALNQYSFAASLKFSDKSDPMDPAQIETTILDLRAKQFSFYNSTLQRFPNLDPDQVRGLDILSQGAKCLNMPPCRSKHQTFGKGMDDTPSFADFGVPQTLGLLVVMAINICSGDRGDRSARLAFVVVFLLGMYQFQLKAFGEVEYNFMEYLISKDMTYHQGFLFIKGITILTYMLLSGLERLISVPFESMRSYYYLKLARMTLYLRVGLRALSLNESVKKKELQGVEDVRELLNIEKMVEEDQENKKLLEMGRSGALLTKAQVMAIDSNF